MFVSILIGNKKQLRSRQSKNGHMKILYLNWTATPPRLQEAPACYMKRLIFPNLHHDERPLFDHHKLICIFHLFIGFATRRGTCAIIRNITLYLRNSMSSCPLLCCLFCCIMFSIRSFNLDTGLITHAKGSYQISLLHGTCRQKKASTAVVISRMEKQRRVTLRKSQFP